MFSDFKKNAGHYQRRTHPYPAQIYGHDNSPKIVIPDLIITCCVERFQIYPIIRAPRHVGCTNFLGNDSISSSTIYHVYLVPAMEDYANYLAL